MESKLIINVNGQECEFHDGDIKNIASLYSMIKSSMAKHKEFIEIYNKESMYLIPTSNIWYVKTVNKEV